MASEIRNIVILTGAGVSAESGVATFRGPDGLWEGHRVEDVCTPEAYARDPVLVHAFYNARRATLATVEPNGAAGQAGVQPGDRVVAVDDLEVATAGATVVSQALAAGTLRAGQIVRLRLDRGGVPLELAVTAAARP